MTPYGLFSFCQNCLGRVAGTIKKFEEAHYFPFYCSLRDYLTTELKLNTDGKVKKFIAVCAKYTGERFDPFQLNSTEYLEIFKEWFSKNSTDAAYFMNINESFRNIYKFCADKNLETLEEYTKKWSVSHLISGVLNENIAYALKVHELPLSKPEVLSINKKFLKHSKMIRDRIQRDKKLNRVITEGIQDVKDKLIWRSKEV